MSLKSNYVIPENGIEIQDAITKIMYFKGSYKQDNRYNVIISTCTYSNIQSKNNGLKPIDENREYSIFLESEDIESTPILEVCYEYLKSLPEFTGAINC